MSVADELQKLVALREAGDISQEEFEAGKRKALGVGEPAMAAGVPEEAKSLSGLIFLGVLVLFAIGVTWHWMSNPSEEARQQADARDTIALCWKDQARKSATPQEQRLVAESCERMERDYRARYGTNP